MAGTFPHRYGVVCTHPVDAQGRPVELPCPPPSSRRGPTPARAGSASSAASSAPSPPAAAVSPAAGAAPPSDSPGAASRVEVSWGGGPSRHPGLPEHEMLALPPPIEVPLSPCVPLLALSEAALQAATARRLFLGQSHTYDLRLRSCGALPVGAVRLSISPAGPPRLTRSGGFVWHVSRSRCLLISASFTYDGGRFLIGTRPHPTCSSMRLNVRARSREITSGWRAAQCAEIVMDWPSRRGGLTTAGTFYGRCPASCRCRPPRRCTCHSR